MKTTNKLICILILLSFASCKKADDTTIPDNYTSVDDFFKKNETLLQSYIINSSTGGSFITPQGTKVSIPSNAFVDLSNNTLAGDVLITFKDIYKKSDMLLSRIPTTTSIGALLVSGGEFYINISSNNSKVQLAKDKKITVIQPAELTNPKDSFNIDEINGFMNPFIAINVDSSSTNFGWGTTTIDSVNYLAGDYIFSLYNFKSLYGEGTWCNSDNSRYFDGYPTTTLTLKSSDSSNPNNKQVFLIFNKLTSMVHVYSNGSNFPYAFAPIGLQCTLVAVDVKNGSLYSAFVPFTISSNQTITFSLSETTTNAFITKLKSLD